MPTQAASEMNTFVFPQIGLQSSNATQIISLDMVALKNGQPWRLADEAVVQYELINNQGSALKLLSEEREGGAGVSAQSDAAGSFDALFGSGLIKLYFQSLGQIHDDLILKVEITQPDRATSFELLIPFEEIFFIPGGSQQRGPMDEDIHIISPLDGRQVCPGETVPLYIQFSEQIKRPDKVLILSPVYSFEDHDVSGHYSLRIEAGTSPGLYEVLVIGVWNVDSQEVTASKLLSLMVIDKKPRPPLRICPLSRR